MSRFWHYRLAWLAVVAITGSFFVANAGADEDSKSRVVNDRCPVMTDEFASPLHEIQYEGVTVRFCCDECRERFLNNPVQYVSRLPQLSPETVQALIAGGQEHARAAQAARWVDRWLQPVMMGVAALLAVWVVIRLARRRRFNRGVPAP